MIRRSLIAVSILAAFGFSANALATVAASDVNTSAGTMDAVVPITYASHVGVSGVGFDANIVDGSNIIVDASETFQVFDFFANAFVNCDGNPVTVANGVTIACSPTGVYSVTRSGGVDLQALAGSMRVLVDIAPAVADGLTATVEFGPLCGAGQTSAIDGCTAYFDGSGNTIAAPAFTIADNGTVTIAGVPDPLTLTVPASVPAFPAGNAGSTSAAQQLTVSAAGNTGTASLANCTAPAGINLNPTSLNFNAAGSQDIAVTCTYGAAAINGNISCTETDDNSAGTARTVSVSCPAGAIVPVDPTITVVSPADGSTTALPGGSVGQSVSTTINYQATGGFGTGSATISCAAAGPVTINPNGLQTVTGSAQPVDITVSCLLTDAEQLGGSVTCAIDDLVGASSDTFNFTCPAGSTVVAPSQPETIPSTSLWSKIGLIGLLAALGALVVGFRRQS